MRIPAALCLVLVSLSVFAQETEETIVADRPGLADGPSTVGSGLFQIETGLAVDESSSAFPTLLRFGLGTRFELRIESDVVGHSDGDTSLAPIAAGFKLGLTEGAFPLSLIASVQPPSGEGGLRTAGYESAARLVGELGLGNDFSLTPNVGFELAEGGQSAALFALTLEKQLGRALPFVDFETRTSDGDVSLIADAGLAWIAGRDTQLDVSAGVDLAGEAYPEWFVSAGYSRRF